MNTTMKRTLFWTPRIVCILFALFLSLLAFDVFGEGYGLWGTILALLMHLVPVYIVVIALIVAWRWEWIGAILFSALAVFYVVMLWGQMHWSAYLGISGPLLLIAILFLLNWIYRGELRTQ